MSLKEPHADLPLPNGTLVMQSRFKGRLSRPMMVLITFAALGTLLLSFNRYSLMASPAQVEVKSFYSTVKTHSDVCPGGVSHTGHIGLESAGRLSFYWFFQAQTRDWKDAPIILTFGGGPGITGLSYPFRGESHCNITETGITPSSYPLTKRFNLLALDHPIGVGFSTGEVFGSSDKVAKDVYDFLQKFFTLAEFKDLAKKGISNKFIISSGSYGGIYLPHVATVIQAGNRAKSGIKIPLDSVILNGPQFDGVTYYESVLKRCTIDQKFSEDQCPISNPAVVECRQKIQRSLECGRPQHRKEADRYCGEHVDKVVGGCYNKIGDDRCYPERLWIDSFIKSKRSDLDLGSQEFHYYSSEVGTAFLDTGDGVQNTQALYEKLLDGGVRILTYVGELDYNCHWSGAFAFLKLLRSRYQRAFIDAEDKPWPGDEKTLVRAVGGRAAEAGTIALVQVAKAGHLSFTDRPEIIKSIIEHWIDNTKFWDT